MRILFFGTPDFAVSSLRALHEAGHEVACVVTRPDRPRGRGRRPAPSAVKKAALELDLDLYQPETVNSPEALERFRREEPELGVIVAYGEILRLELLEVPERGFINLHASLLPRYRGAAPINWALIRGEKHTGVTIQRLAPRMDAGPILAQREVKIGPEETAGQLHDRLAEIGAAELAALLHRLEAGKEVPERPQDPEEVTYAPKLNKEHGRVDWTLPAEEIRHRVRGVTPWPGATTHFCGQHRCEEVTLTRVGTCPGVEGDEPPGTVLEITGEERLIVRAGRGAVVVQRLKPAGSREMDAADFVHGHRVERGDKFE